MAVISAREPHVPALDRGVLGGSEASCLCKPSLLWPGRVVGRGASLGNSRPPPLLTACSS
ncbi:hypothetical protein E2C01_052103 [Portunus trituberculatus]|uniref:Uncharacterized protein n=1 Tax=Portunus trituberculatus TaxID=210409 RepID=A0A5B7GM52_PORTR|nr:hypothetical protein [Portunus trituberculatus]